MTFNDFNAGVWRARAAYRKAPISTRYCADERCYETAIGSSDLCTGHQRVVENGLAEFIEEEP